MTGTNSPKRRALGVDLGSKRIGLALSDSTRTVALPHEVLSRSDDHAHDHFAILETARENGAATIVVGLPLSLSGKIGPAAKAALAEVEELRAAAPDEVEVVAYDERLTTVSADRALDEARVPRAQRKDVVDKIAATVMLQAFLDGQNPSGSRT